MQVYGETETNTYYYLKDHLGSVIGITDESGDLVESYTYDAWGNVTVYDATGSEIAESAIGNRYTFQGREISWATGLYYFRARWYDASVGRFLSKDPIGISGGLNQYVFCHNDPVNYIDPTGLCGESKQQYVEMPNGQKIPMPPGVDIYKNMERANEIGWREFYNLVRKGGDWDYKQQGDPLYEPFGNFHYGIVGRAAGFTERRLLREAGRAQVKRGNGGHGPGDPGWLLNPFGGTAPYGDHQNDQDNIRQGFIWYNQNANPGDWMDGGGP